MDGRSQLNRRLFGIVVGAGAGARLGLDVPKAFVKLSGISLLARSASAFLKINDVAHVMCVVPEGWSDTAHREVESIFPNSVESRVSFCIGRDTRNGSVRAGLAALHSKLDLQPFDIVGVHDAARCLVTCDLICRCFDGAINHGAASAASPIRDTLKRVVKGNDGAYVRKLGGMEELSSNNVERAGLYAMHTPQTFTYEVLGKALEMTKADDATDEVSIVEKIQDVSIIESPLSNFKITHPEDLKLAEKLLS